MLVEELISKLMRCDPKAEAVTSERGTYINTWVPIQAPIPKALRKTPNEPFHYYESHNPDEDNLTKVMEI